MVPRISVVLVFNDRNSHNQLSDCICCITSTQVCSLRTNIHIGHINRHTNLFLLNHISNDCLCISFSQLCYVSNIRLVLGLWSYTFDSCLFPKPNIGNIVTRTVYLSPKAENSFKSLLLCFQNKCKFYIIYL